MDREAAGDSDRQQVHATSHPVEAKLQDITDLLIEMADKIQMLRDAANESRKWQQSTDTALQTLRTEMAPMTVLETKLDIVTSRIEKKQEIEVSRIR